MASGKPQVFTRDATGLVRSLGWWDSFGVGFGGVVLGVAMTSFYYAIPSTLPNANLVGSLLFLLIVLVPYLIVYTQLAFAMPRSGGDYIYVSRLLHPAIGFMQSWLATFIVVLNLPIFSDLVTSLYLPSFLTDLGYSQIAPMFSDLTVRFVIDSLIIIFSTLMMIIPLRSYAKVQTILVLASLISPFVMLGALTIGHDAFVSMWNSVSTVSYQQVIANAQKAGYATPQPNLTQTVIAAPILGFYLLTIWPVQIAGELKDLKKSIFSGLLGAVLFSWIMFTVGVLLYYGTVGFDFANSLIALGSNSPVNPPLLNSIIGFVYHNPAISAAMDIGLVAASLVVIPQSILVVTRWIFAWSFDRIAPAKFAEVHPTFSTPYISVIAAFIAGEILLVFTLYTGVVSIILNAALGSAISFVPALLSGMLLPWRGKAIFEQAPPFTRTKIGRIPLITICGAIAGFGIIAYTVILLANPQLGFPVTPASGAFMLGWLVFGVVLYFVAKAYRKRQGLDISAAFREIPPE
ncbi:MAG TPA: APC family permease [Candidatus Acidoferrales bacterium]|nr:APC family permease [Candidatus Acidoferrales bacterium]